MASFSAIQNEGFTVISNSLLRYYPSLKISETEAMLLLQLESFKQEKKFFPSDNNLSERMNLSPIEISQLIQNLIDKNLIELGQKRDGEGRITNFYDLNHLYQKLMRGKHLIKIKLLLNPLHLLNNPQIQFKSW